MSLIAFSIYAGLCDIFCLSGQADELVSDQIKSPEPMGQGTEAGVSYIRKVTFHGNSAIGERTLSAILGISSGQRFDPELIETSLHKVLGEYKKLGYLFTKADWKTTLVGKDQVIIDINIHEGNIVKMGQIELSGNTTFPKERLLKEFDVYRNQLFDENIFQKDMERVLRLYSDNGHPLAKLSPKDFLLENGKLNIKVDIEEGPLLKIGQIKIDGLKKTKERTALRELTIRPGDTFDQRKVDESQRRLLNCGYFRDVSQISFSQAENSHDSGEADFTIAVTEGRTGRFSGVLGYNPSEEGGKFIGTLEAIENNLFGTGRQMSVRGRFGKTDAYEFAYKEPWVFGAPINIGITFRETKRDYNLLTPSSLREGSQSENTYVKEREVGLIGTARIFNLTDGSLTLMYKRIKSWGTADNVTDGKKYSLILSLQRDSRDYFLNPSMGRSDIGTLEISRGDFKILKAWLDLNQYFRTFQRQVLAVGIHGARAWGERIPPTELLYLGGANSLRGYSEDFFRGEGRFFANCEYRFLVGRDSQFFLFLDGGTVFNKGEGLSPLKLGYGLGMRLESLTGLVSIDYGLAKGDPFIQGKIHVSLGAMF